MEFCQSEKVGTLRMLKSFNFPFVIHFVSFCPFRETDNIFFDDAPKLSATLPLVPKIDASAEISCMMFIRHNVTECRSLIVFGTFFLTVYFP